MLIQSLEISNYKSLSKQTIEDFSSVNMIYGHNNSGKSNILKLIHLIFKRKISPEGNVVVPEQSSSQGGLLPEEKFMEKSQSNWWEGIIQNEPFIFRNGDLTKDIEFKIVVGIQKSEIKTALGEDEFEEVKSAYFNEEMLKSATEDENKARLAASEAVKKKSGDQEELKAASKIAKRILDRHQRANGGDNELLDIEFSGVIKSRGTYDSEIVLVRVAIFSNSIFEIQEGEVKVYFQHAPENSKVRSSGFSSLDSILDVLNDSVLFLDNDRYFTKEKEDKNLSDNSPRTFKNWLHNLSLESFEKDSYERIFNQVNKFAPGGSAQEMRMERNSPLGSVDIEFFRSKGEIDILLRNKVNPNKRLSIESFGTGIQQILYILTRIAESQPKVVLLEEIELNLSPKYQNAVIRHLESGLINDPDSNFQQLFFTSHSPLLSVNSQYQIHQVSINENGESSVSKANKDSIREFYPKEVIDALIEQTA